MNTNDREHEPINWRIWHLIGYAQSCRDFTPEARGWFDRLCELADDLEAELRDEHE